MLLKRHSIACRYHSSRYPWACQLCSTVLGNNTVIFKQTKYNNIHAIPLYCDLSSQSPELRAQAEYKDEKSRCVDTELMTHVRHEAPHYSDWVSSKSKLYNVELPITS